MKGSSFCIFLIKLTPPRLRHKLPAELLFPGTVEALPKFSLKFHIAEAGQHNFVKFRVTIIPPVRIYY